mmetsp:Transcript_15281/g.27787  ORF Transcript_15281/g.27787 Transcript_15281/m.27787 type:complete len:482 (-) Transcript_15281:109-1554(-)
MLSRHRRSVAGQVRSFFKVSTLLVTVAAVIMINNILYPRGMISKNWTTLPLSPIKNWTATDHNMTVDYDVGSDLQVDVPDEKKDREGTSIHNKDGVSCGNHFAQTCADCPQGNGESWCNGACVWSSENGGECQSRSLLEVNCGGHFAKTCFGCSQGKGKNQCNGDCSWWPSKNGGVCLPFEYRSSEESVSLNVTDNSQQTCLRDRISHPVPDRESTDGQQPYPDLSSVRILGDMLSESVMKHLNESKTVDAIRGRPFVEKCVKSRIPKKLHWVWFGSELPEKYVSNIEAMAKVNLDWEVFFWSELPSKPLQNRLEKHGVQYNFRNVTKYLKEGLFMNGDLIEREENLAGKSDYLRMEVVYMEGGIYQDTDASPVQPFDYFGDLFRWPFAAFDTSYKNVCNCVFAFGKGSRFLEFAIKLTRENCITYHTCGVMSGAGPDFLTAALFYYDDPDVILIDTRHIIQQSKTSKSVTYHTMDATWLR